MEEGLSRRRAVRSALALGGAIALAFAIVTLLARNAADPSEAHAGGSDALLETSLSRRGPPSAAPSAARSSPADASALAALRQEDLRTPGVPRKETEEMAVTARRRQMLVLGKYYMPAWWMRKAKDTDKYYPFLTADGGKGFAPGNGRFEDLDEDSAGSQLSQLTRGTGTDPAMCIKKEGDPCAPPDAVMITPDFACKDGKVVPYTSSGSSPAKPPSSPEAKHSVSPYRPFSDGETPGTCIYNCEKQPGDVCVEADASLIPQAYACVDGFVVPPSFSTEAQSARTTGTTALAEVDAAPAPSEEASKDETKPDPEEPTESQKKETAPEVKTVDKYAPTYSQPMNVGAGYGQVYPNANGFTLPPGEGCPMSWEQVQRGAKSFPGCPPIPPMPMCPYDCKPADESFTPKDKNAPTCPYPCLEFDESTNYIAQRTPIAAPDKAETGPLNGPNHDKGEQGAIAETAYTAADGGLPIPGTSFLGYGFDGKKDCLFEQCATLPIIKWTYDQDKVVVTPAGTYRVPDQMRVINQYDTTARTEVYSSFSQVEEALVSESSASGSSLAVSGSASASFSTSSSSENEKWYSTRKMDVKLYSLQVRVSNIQEATNFEFYDEVRKLPLRFLDSPRKFLHFIQKWGPYVVLDATFGGTLELTLVTERSSDISSSDIAAAIEGEYNGIMASGSVKSSFAMSSKSKQVSESSQTAIHSNGGDPAVARVITDIRPGIEKPMFRGDFESWLNSVPHFPRAINKIPTLTEIYKLVPGTDDESISRRNALQMACAVYVGDATASTSSMECIPDQGSLQPTNTAGGSSDAAATKQTTKIGSIAVTWANYNRISTNECIRFAARGAGEIDVVFSSVISKEETWTRVRITHEGAQIFEGSTMKASTMDSGAAAMGSEVIFEDYWICIFPDTISYGKGASEYITWKKGSPIIKPRFYGFGCSTPTSFASVQIVNPDCKWMGSDTEPYLIEAPEDDPVEILSITEAELKVQGGGIQDNDCHKWMCRTTLDAGSEVVKQNGEEWYPARIYTSKELSCDISHLRSLNPSSSTVSAFVEVSHLTFKFDSDKPENLKLDKKYGFNIQLKRCPGGANANGRWVDCYNGGTCRDTGALEWECSCKDPWGGDTCKTCKKNCLKSFPTETCDGCKACAGFLEPPACKCTDRSKTDISEQCLEVDNSCAFCRKCKTGYLGDRCELKYEFSVGVWGACKANENGHECGDSEKTRTVTCTQINPFKRVSDSLCTKAGLTKSTTVSTCTHSAKCLYQWLEYKDWKSADGKYPDCGYYNEYQTVVCVASWATSKKVADERCTKTKPSSGPRRVFKGFCGRTALDYKPTRHYFTPKKDNCITGTTDRHFLSIGGERVWPTGDGREFRGLQTFLWPQYKITAGSPLKTIVWPITSTNYEVDTQQVKACDSDNHEMYAFAVSVQDLGDCKVTQSRGYTSSQSTYCPNGYTIISGGCESTHEMGQAWADIPNNRFVCGGFAHRTTNDHNYKNTWITSEAMCCKTDKIRSGCKWVQANNNWVRGQYEVKAECPSGHYLYGGSCNTDSTIGSFYPFVRVSPERDGKSWMCKTMDPTAIAANAYCCPESGVIPDEVIY